MFTHTKKNITELKPIVVFTGPNSRGEEQSELKNLLPALLVQLLLNSPDTVITNPNSLITAYYYQTIWALDRSKSPVLCQEHIDW
jgi:hypothetical protein